jgi:uncharacterized protein YuzE
MKLHYYADTDSLYIDLSEKVSVESREVSPGVVLDFDDAGRTCGIDVDQASQNWDSYLLSESALAKNWLRPEEDKAWQYL